MPKTKEQKKTILGELKDNLGAQQSVAFVDYKGIGVKELSLLRKQLKDVGAKLQVAKKTLLQKAFGEKGIDTNFKGYQGQVALVYSFQEPLAGIKAAHAFAKTNEHLKFLGGYMENELLSEAQMQELALIPSREQLLSRFIGTISAPMEGMVRVLGGNIKGLLVALSAIQEKKV
jgi:large subunit ribosomal protein L10